MFKILIKSLLFTIIGLLIFDTVYGINEFVQESEYVPFVQRRILARIDEDKFKAAVNFASASIKRQERFEKNLADSNIIVADGSVSHAQLLETLPSKDAQNYDQVAKQILKATQYIYETECLNGDDNASLCARYMSNRPLPESQLRDECLEIRTNKHDGVLPYRRLLRANYKDGISKMITEPRVEEIMKLFGIDNVEYSNVENHLPQRDWKAQNVVLVQWAQFIEHDLSKSVVTTMKNGTPIECCTEYQNQLTPRHRHPACAPVIGAARQRYGESPCLNYIRSSLAVDRECEFGPAQQLNQASNLLDLSQLYGFSKDGVESRMRAYRDGLLKTFKDVDAIDGLDFLPLAENSQEFCVNKEGNCFMAGDSRVNSNPYMTMIYTIFLRYHNMMAKNLKKQNPSWHDEKLFIESRKKTIEIYHCIIYNEWLPAVLGENITEIINEEPLNIIKRKGDDFVSNEFAIAAIRFYYSMMPNVLYGFHLSKDNSADRTRTNIKEIFQLKNHFYETEFLSESVKMDMAMNAALNQQAKKMDSNFVDALTTHYLQTRRSLNKTTGIDAVAWDIQRGRDHGLAPYVRYLEHCTRTQINSWEDLLPFIKSQDIERLRAVYKTFKNIDLIVGGIFEKKLRDSTLGTTFTCILSEQFSNSRRAYWRATSGADVDKQEVDAVGDAKCSPSHRLLCETTGLFFVPRNIFFTPSDSNPIELCNGV